MNKKKRALALGLAAAQLTALSAVVAPLTTVSAFAETAENYTVTANINVDDESKALGISDDGAVDLTKDSEGNAVTVDAGAIVNISIGDIAKGKKIYKVTLNDKEAAAVSDGSYNYTVAEGETSISVAVEVVTELEASYTAESVTLAGAKPDNGAYELTNDDKSALLTAAKAAVKIGDTAVDANKLTVDGSTGYGAVTGEGNDVSVTVTLTLTEDAETDYAYAEDAKSVTVNVPVAYKAAEKTALTLEIGEVSLGDDLTKAPADEEITEAIKKAIKFKNDKSSEVTLTEGASGDYTAAVAAKDGDKTGKVYTVTVTIVNTESYTLEDNTADVTISYTVKKTVGVTITNSIPQADGADKVTVSLKSGDKETDSETVVGKDDTLTLTVTLADGYKYAENGALAVEAKVGDTAATVSEASIKGNAAEYTITVPDLAAAADGAKLTVTVTGTVEKDVTPCTIKLPANGTGYTVAATYNDGESDQSVTSEVTEIPNGTDVKITVTAAEGCKLVDAKLGDSAAVTSTDGSKVELTYTVAKPENGTVIDLSGALTVNTLQIIKPTFALDNDITEAAPVELDITESELAGAEDADLTNVAKAVKVTDSSDAAVTLAAGDYTLTVGKTNNGGKLTVTFALTEAGGKKYAIDDSVTSFTIDVPVKFAVEYAVSAKNVDNATITLDKNKGKAGAEITITVAPDSGYVINTVPTLTGVTFAKDPETKAWSGKYTVSKPEDDSEAIELVITAAVLRIQTFTAPTFAVDPETNKAALTFTDEGTYTVDGAETVIDNENKTVEYNDDKAGAKIAVVLKGDGTATADSEPAEVTVPGRGAKPTGLSYSADEENATENGFTITGLDTTMQYSTDGTAWTNGTAQTKLTAGDYKVRTKATTSAFASDPIDLKVTSEAYINVEAEAAEIADMEYNSARETVDVTITLSNIGANTDAVTAIVLPEGWTAKSGVTDGKITITKGGTAEVVVSVPASDAKAYSGTVKFTTVVEEGEAAEDLESADISFTITKKELTVTLSASGTELTSDGGDVTISIATLPAGVTAALTCAGAAVDGMKITLPANATAEDKTYTVSAAFTSDNYAVTAENITLTVKGKTEIVDPGDDTEYTITVAKTGTGDGTVTVTPNGKAVKGTKVKVTAQPDSSSEGGTITVKDADGNTVAFSDGEFTMPEKNVTITVSFSKKSAAPSKPSGGSSSSSGSSGGRRPSSSGSSNTSTGMTNSEVSAEIKNAKEGDTVKIDNNVYIFSDVVKEAAAKKSKLEVKLDSTFTWTIDSTKLTDTNTALRLSVTTKTADTAKTAKIEKSAGADDRTDVCFETLADNLGTGAKLTVRTASKSTDALKKFANLYKDNGSGTLVFAGVAPIDENGFAVLPISEAAAYTIVVSTETKKPGDINNDCKVDMSDLTAMLRKYVNSTNLTRANEFKMDYDGDNKCQLGDITALLKDYVNNRV